MPVNLPSGRFPFAVHQFDQVFVVVEHEAPDLGVCEGAVDAEGLEGAGGDAKHFTYLVRFEPFPLFGFGLSEEVLQFLEEFGFKLLQIVFGEEFD